MGYHTHFEGEFTLDRPLTPEHRAYLKAFSTTRRMARDAALTAERDDPVRLAAGLPVGDEGGYFVGAGGYAGQENANAPDIVNYDIPPEGQPYLWCHWGPNDAGTAIVWDGREKFFQYVEWLRYLVEHFLAPWGYTLNGEVWWEGEGPGDLGKIVVKDNDVRAKGGTVVYDD